MAVSVAFGLVLLPDPCFEDAIVTEMVGDVGVVVVVVLVFFLSQ